MVSFGLQNADPDVRVDMETFLSKVVPEVRHLWTAIGPILSGTVMPACVEEAPLLGKHLSSKSLSWS